MPLSFISTSKTVSAQYITRGHGSRRRRFGKKLRLDRAQLSRINHARPPTNPAGKTLRLTSARYASKSTRKPHQQFFKPITICISRKKTRPCISRQFRSRARFKIETLLRSSSLGIAGNVIVITLHYRPQWLAERSFPLPGGRPSGGGGAIGRVPPGLQWGEISLRTVRRGPRQ